MLPKETGEGLKLICCAVALGESPTTPRNTANTILPKGNVLTTTPFVCDSSFCDLYATGGLVALSPALVHQRSAVLIFGE